MSLGHRSRYYFQVYPSSQLTMSVHLGLSLSFSARYKSSWQPIAVFRKSIAHPPSLFLAARYRDPKINSLSSLTFHTSYGLADRELMPRPRDRSRSFAKTCLKAPKLVKGCDPHRI